MEKEIKKLKDHFIVCGFGRVGRNVAAELQATHRRYVAIDENGPMLEEQKERNPDLLYRRISCLVPSVRCTCAIPTM